jgi:hypothetical protein
MVVLFSDPVQARDCANEIEQSIQHKVQLCGCQVTIEVEQFLEQLRSAGF